MSSTNSFSVLSNNQRSQRPRASKPYRKSSAKVGSSARSGSSASDGWKTKTRGSSRSSRSSASRPSRSRGKYSNSRVPKAEESKKELEVLTLPKIQNPVYLKLAQKELPSLKSKSVNDVPEKIASSNPLSSSSYPELSQIIKANQISRKKFIQRDIERWARLWKNELRYIHSAFVPDFDYRDFVEVAYSTTPKNASFHRTLHIGEGDLGYPHASDMGIDTSYKNMANIRNYCQERVLPFFRDVDMSILDVFDRDDQDSYDSYNTPREDCEDDDDWFNQPLGW